MHNNFINCILQKKSMGLFDFFKRTPQLIDPVFGKIKRGVTGTIWSSCLFKPLNANIKCYIDTYDTQPSETQREFYKKIENNYAELKSKIIPVLLDTFRNADENFEIGNLDTEFKLVCISLPDCKMRPFKWEICYTTDFDRDHDFTIYFNDFEPEGDVHVNG